MDDAVNEAKENQEKLELLLWASARGLLADAQALISQGADPACKDKHGRTPSHYAAAHGHVSLLMYYATRGVDLDVEDAEGRGPLHYAALGDHVEVVEFLCSKGTWVDAPDGKDDSPLHLAARGLPPSVDDTVNATSTKGGKEAPQSRRDAAAALRALVRAGAKLDVRNARALTPLGEAVVNNHVGAVLALLEARAMATVTVKGYSLLHIAAAMGHYDCLERLLVEGRRPDANSKDNPEGLGPLHAALQNGQWTCAKLLLERGADDSLEDSKGRLPYDFLDSTAATTTTAATASSTEVCDASAVLSALRRRLQKAAAARGGGTVPKGEGKEQVKGREPAAAEVTGPKPSPPLGPREQFKALDRKEQVRKVMAYAAMGDSELRQLPFPPPEALPVIQALRKAQGLHTCWEAVAAIRQDGSFQEDASDSHVQLAVEDLKKPHVDTTKYMQDHQVQRVFNKMNKLHGILRQHGQGFKVALEDLIAKPKGPQSVSETLRQLEVLSKRLKEAQDAAVAEVAGEALAQSKGPLGTQTGKDKDRGKGQASESMEPSSLLDSPLETVEEGKEGPIGWREWGWDGVKFFMAHAMRGVFATCLMLMVMWIMGLLPDQVRDRTTSMEQGLQETLHAQHLSSVDGGVLGGGGGGVVGAVGQLLEALVEGDGEGGGAGEAVTEL